MSIVNLVWRYNHYSILEDSIRYTKASGILYEMVRKAFDYIIPSSTNTAEDLNNLVGKKTHAKRIARNLSSADGNLRFENFQKAAGRSLTGCARVLVSANLPVCMLRLVKAVFPFLVFSVFVPCPALFGASSLPLDLPEITKQAEVIADVTVQNVTSHWSSPSGVTSIHTRVDFSVNKLLKGSVPTTFSLEFLGGQVGNRGLRVPGVPQFSKGERFVIFSRAPETHFVSPIIGIDQGSLRVIRDNESNSDRVFRHWGQPVSEMEDFKSRVPVGPTTNRNYLRSAETVDHFLGRVTRLMNQ